MLSLVSHESELTKEDYLTWPYFEDDEINKVSQILASGRVNYWTGQEGRLFEAEYAKAVGTKYAVALMNGTVALEAALAAFDIGPGDEVITTCRTFVASASCIVMRGAKPVLADVDPVSGNMTAESIRKVITNKTKAIIAVHIAGWPCDMDPIMKLAEEHQLYVIEDCAQAHGAQYKGRAVGSIGHVGAFSFCQDKIISTGGEGGMITTNDETIWEKIWSLKDHGKNYDVVYNKEHPPGFRWLTESFGTNWRMTELQAAIGRMQLAKLNEWVRLRQHNASILEKEFSKITAFRVTPVSSDMQHAYYKYYVYVKPEMLKEGWNRDRIMQSIESMGVPCYSGICSEIYLEKAFKDKGWQPEQRYQTAKELGETSLLFLVHPTLTDEHMYYAGFVVERVMEEASR